MSIEKNFKVSILTDIFLCDCAMCNRATKLYVEVLPVLYLSLLQMRLLRMTRLNKGRSPFNAMFMQIMYIWGEQSVDKSDGPLTFIRTRNSFAQTLQQCLFVLRAVPMTMRYGSPPVKFPALLEFDQCVSFSVSGKKYSVLKMHFL